MKLGIKSWEKTRGEIVRNPHFWAILFLMVVVTLIYYQDVLFGAQFLWYWNLQIFEFNYHMHGILFSVPFVYAVFVFWWQGALVTWLLAIAIIIPRILFFHQSTYSIVVNLLYLLMPMVVVFYIAMELRWREKERKVSAEREAERQEYMAQIFKAQENERQRISRELHDETLQTLLVIATRAEELGAQENVKNLPQSRIQAEWIRDATLSISQELRRLSLDLRPAVLDNLGLVPAIRWLVSELSRDHISGRLEVTGALRTLSPEIDINIFRIAQEALNNIRRHSRASEALVSLEFGLDFLKLTVRDNGNGFSPQITTGELTALGKLGLTGIQQRVKILNGIFTLDAAPGKGAEISIRIKA
jgi:two-component system, NarL family, sensor histidine kinase DegS